MRHLAGLGRLLLVSLAIGPLASWAASDGEFFTAGRTQIGPGCVVDDVSPATVTEQTQTMPRCDTAGNLRTTLGGAVTTKLTVASGVTTNTTTASLAVPSGSKSFYGQVVCSSGACTQTQALYGDIDDDEANGILLCTLTLSGTTRAQDACPVITAAFSYYYVVTTNTTGTSATGAVYAMY